MTWPRVASPQAPTLHDVTHAHRNYQAPFADLVVMECTPRWFMPGKPVFTLWFNRIPYRISHDQALALGQAQNMAAVLAVLRRIVTHPVG